MHVRDCRFSICRVVIEYICRASVRHNYTGTVLAGFEIEKITRVSRTGCIQRKIKALDVPKAPEYLEQVRFSNILG
jgi:hypothetical protein